MPITSEQIQLDRCGHGVHFYETETELAETVSGYLARALRRGDVGVLIATRQHLRAFESELAAAGVDLDDVLRSGRLTYLDGQETLRTLMTPGGVDPQAFELEIGTRLRAARRGGSTVAAYGEMVDLLWQAGDVTSAIELERLWNELIDELQFSLLCAYKSAAVAPPEHEQALRQVCQLHSSVSSADATLLDPHSVPRLASREFQPSPDAPRAARRFIEEALEDWGHSGTVVNDARLVVSELVSNAVVHAHGPVSVSITATCTKLRLAVRDLSLTPPILRSGSTDTTYGGQGLRIVGALASAWGVETTAYGKTVWADF